MRLINAPFGEDNLVEITTRDSTAGGIEKNSLLFFAGLQERAIGVSKF